MYTVFRHMIANLSKCLLEKGGSTFIRLQALYIQLASTDHWPPAYDVDLRDHNNAPLSHRPTNILPARHSSHQKLMTSGIHPLQLPSQAKCAGRHISHRCTNQHIKRLLDTQLLSGFEAPPAAPATGSLPSAATRIRPPQRRPPLRPPERDLGWHCRLAQA